MFVMLFLGFVELPDWTGPSNYSSYACEWGPCTEVREIKIRTTRKATECVERLAQLVRSLTTNQKVPGSVLVWLKVGLWATLSCHTIHGQGR